MKKPAIIASVVIIAVIALVGGIWLFTRDKKTETAAPAQKKRVSEPLNVISVDARPYIKIVPASDGRNIDIVVETLNKPATEAEYELEYQSGSLLQGAFGNIVLSDLPAKKTVLLGSCSAGGACTYHENVVGGSLVTRFSGPENYALKSDWHYIDNKSGEDQVSSRDAKFQLTADSLKKIRYAVVFNAPGMPETAPGTLMSDPYSLTASSPLSGKGSLTIRANQEGALKIAGWDGKTWKTFEGTVDGKAVTAEVELMELYVAVVE